MWLILTLLVLLAAGYAAGGGAMVLFVVCVLALAAWAWLRGPKGKARQ